MENDFVLQVLQLKGVEEPLSCSVKHDGTELGVLLLPTTETHIEVPSEGRLQLQFCSAEQTCVGSVSFSPCAVRSCAWLPLFPDGEADYVERASDVACEPGVRVELQLLDSSCFSEEPLFTEEALSSEGGRAQPEAWLERFQGLQKKIIDLEHNLESERWQFQREVDSLSHSHRCKEETQSLALEHLTMVVSHERTLKQDLASQVGMLREKITALEQANESISSKATTVLEQYEANLNKHEASYQEQVQATAACKADNTRLEAQVRELSQACKLKDNELALAREHSDILQAKLSNLEARNYAGRLEILDKQLQESEQQREKLRAELEKLQHSTGVLFDKFKFNQQFSVDTERESLQNQLADLQQHLKERQFYILDLETENTRLTREVDKGRKTDRATIEQLNKDIEALQQENFGLRSQLDVSINDQSSIIAETNCSYSSVDSRLEKLISEKGINQAFEMLKPGTYYFRSRKVSVRMNNECDKSQDSDHREASPVIAPPSYKQKILGVFQAKNMPKDDALNASAELEPRHKSNPRAQVKPFQQPREKMFVPLRRADKRTVRKK